MHEATLNSAQRGALRNELQVWAALADDFQLCVEQWDAGTARRILEMTLDVAELMDAIGWSEQSDAPDVQPVRLSTRGLAAARKGAQDLQTAMARDEIAAEDSIPEQYGALCALAGGDA